jgi:hypothetical protein
MEDEGGDVVRQRIGRLHIDSDRGHVGRPGDGRYSHFVVMGKRAGHAWRPERSAHRRSAYDGVRHPLVLQQMPGKGARGTAGAPGGGPSGSKGCGLFGKEQRLVALADKAAAEADARRGHPLHCG